MGQKSNDRLKEKTKNKVSKSPKKDVSQDPVNTEETVQKLEQEKKIWSSDDLREAMKPTCEELDYRNSKCTNFNPLEKYSRLFKCTKCQKNLKQTIQLNKKPPVHPCLGVLMCEKCCAYYEDGEFSLDSDGEDKYCRWCGEGGTLFACSNCICGFCANCIKQHFSLKFFKDIQKNENWLCFFCDPKPLWDVRYICSLAVQMAEESVVTKSDVTKSSPRSKINEQKNEPVKEKESENTETTYPPTLQVKEESTSSNVEPSRPQRKRVLEYSSSSDDTECEAPKSPVKKFKFTSSPLRKLVKEMEVNSDKEVKKNVLADLKKLLKLSENQMDLGVRWCRSTLRKLSKPKYTATQEDLVEECKKIKWFLSVLSTYLVQFSNSVDSIERGLCQGEGEKVSHVFKENNQSPYTIILQFLGFINNQVKTFVRRGVSFSDILEDGVHDDGSIIGLLKKDSSKNKSANTTAEEVNTDAEAAESKDEKEDGGEDSLDCETEPNNDSSVRESDSPYSAFGETNNFKDSEPAQEIQKLISILENA